MNQTMKRSIVEESVRIRGLIGTLELTQKMNPRLELFSISGGWVEDKEINIIKFKGQKGDLIIELV